MRPRNRLMAMLLFLGILLVTTTGCETLRQGEMALANLQYSPQVEYQIGNQFAEQLSEEYKIIREPEAQAWLDKMGQRLLRAFPPVDYQYNFYLVESPEVNAFAVPGGHCYVNVGLILFADNEAQVAAVVGHEIAHIIARHGMRNIQRIEAAQLAGGAISSRIEDDLSRQAAAVAIQGGTYLAMRQFSRDDEREADRLGVQAMIEAGYDPREGVQFFEKLNALQGGAGDASLLSKLMSTHPPTPERIDNIHELISEFDLTRYPMQTNSPEFEAARAALRERYPGM